MESDSEVLELKKALRMVRLELQIAEVSDPVELKDRLAELEVQFKDGPIPTSG